MLRLGDPIAIFGDLHGHFYDLLNIFGIIHGVSHFKLLFLGDYVDRGPYSMEIVLFLYALKVPFHY